MLTCKVGESIINTFEYSDEQIRKWSNKGILKCPVCNSIMIYRNGEIKIAHFAHEKDADCEDIYSESETYEHLKGKKMLYEWLRTQPNIKNLKLEAWLPETKQRPDIYFEINNNKYVIEFQCTPISTEYLQRRRLYKLAGIHDIWILGIDKYNINFNNTIISHHERFKEIEKYDNSYLNVCENALVLTKQYIQEYFFPKPLEFIILNSYEKYNITDLHINDNKLCISPNNNIIDELLNKNSVMEQKVLERLRLQNERNAREEALRIENELKYNDRKKVFDSLSNYINDKYDYSKFTKNLTYRCTKKGHAKYTSGLPCLNYFYSDFTREHRLYLNNFNLAYPGKYIEVKDCDSFTQVERYLHNLLDFDELFTLEELIKVDGIIEEIVNNFTNYKFIIEIRNLNELSVTLNYYDDYNFSIYTLHKNGSVDISDIYTNIYNQVITVLKECEKENFKLKLVGNLIKEINNKYSTKVKGNWSFKRVSNEIRILKNNTIAIKNVGADILEAYKDNKIDFKTYKLQLEEEISSKIREYIFSKEALND